jgi:hypothetical protein
MASAAKEALEITLERLIGAYDAGARDDGHQPERWDIREDFGDLVASTRCSRCGKDAVVRAGDDRTWRAGKMRLDPCPIAPE